MPNWWTTRRKKLVSGGLAVLALLLAFLSRTLPAALAALAMCLSALGDAVLGGYPACFARVRDKLVKGGVIFLGAHVLYILALIPASGRDASALLPHCIRPLILFSGLTALLTALFAFRGRGARPPAFSAAAFAYLLAVGVHAAAAFTAAGQGGGWLALNAAGALLFYLSDAILLARSFGAFHGRDMTDPIWFTYAPAQLCILLGFFLSGPAAG